MTWYTDQIQTDPRYLSSRKISDRSLLFPPFDDRLDAFLLAAQRAGHDVRVLETFRSERRQKLLYAQKLTELYRVGVHGFGLAADIGVYVKGVYQDKAAAYFWIPPLAEAHGLISGVDWGHHAPPYRGFWQDPGHIQFIPVSRQNDLFDLAWYPPNDYTPFADSTLIAQRKAAGLPTQDA